MTKTPPSNEAPSDSLLHRVLWVVIVGGVAVIIGVIFWCSNITGHHPDYFWYESSYPGIKLFSPVRYDGTNDPIYNDIHISEEYLSGTTKPDLFIRFPGSEEVHRLRDLPEEVVAKLPKVGWRTYEPYPDTSFYYRDGKLLYVKLSDTYNPDHDGRELMHYDWHARLTDKRFQTKYEIGSSRDGPFLSLPISHRDLVRVFGPPATSTVTRSVWAGPSFNLSPHGSGDKRQVTESPFVGR